jgi:hypothetical protein
LNVPHRYCNSDMGQLTQSSFQTPASRRREQRQAIPFWALGLI